MAGLHAAVIAALLLAALSSVLSGAVNLGLRDVMMAIMSPAEASARDVSILWSVRLPRTVMAMLVGAGLGISGAVMQGLFRNSLADPGLTGVSSGAALGAVTTIVLGQNLLGRSAAYLLPPAAFLGGLLVTFLLYGLATRSGRTSVSMMLLGGIAIGALSMAATGLLIFISSEQQLRELTFWSMGSLAGATWAKVASLLVCATIALPFLPLLLRTLDRLSLGEAEAAYMGVNVERSKLAAITLTALLTGCAVAVSGVIGFVGLIVPHLLRIGIGPSHRLLLPMSALLGALLMLIADQIARSIAAPAELPIGIVTAAVGGPVFLWMLMTSAAAEVH
ncbi:FecCD family ABC transporter permease [Aestuariivirga sp.]|uniref:FecCD family ABC transporter permease n=1 Tax=Aestuariivirga sp. TaxID=2650926 RepID=UPI003BAAAC0D